MMFRGNNDVFHAGFRGEIDPGLGIEKERVEHPGIGLVFLNGDLASMHDPLASSPYGVSFVSPAQNGVDAPVDEHAEARFLPPSHTGFTIFRCFLQVVGLLSQHRISK